MGPTLARRYRIYIGYPSYAGQRMADYASRALILAGIENFTRYMGQGHWNGTSETAIIFEVISSEPDMGLRVQRVAATLKAEGEQEAVLLTVEPTETYVI